MASCPGVLAHANHSSALTSQAALKSSTDINENRRRSLTHPKPCPDAELQLIGSPQGVPGRGTAYGTSKNGMALSVARGQIVRQGILCDHLKASLGARRDVRRSATLRTSSAGLEVRAQLHAAPQLQQQLSQGGAALGIEGPQDLILDLREDRPQLRQPAPPRRGEAHYVAPAVPGIAMPLNEALLLETIEHPDQLTAVEAKGIGDGRLGVLGPLVEQREDVRSYMPAPARSKARKA